MLMQGMSLATAPNLFTQLGVTNILARDSIRYSSSSPIGSGSRDGIANPSLPGLPLPTDTPEDVIDAVVVHDGMTIFVSSSPAALFSETGGYRPG
jgi:hypothetical protein